MSVNIDPAGPCPCGSGLTYRECCGREIRTRRRQRMNALIFGTLILAGIGYGAYRMYQIDRAERDSIELPEGAYYSEEHEHWHDKNHDEIKIPGKVWSPTRNRWLNVTDTMIEEARRELAHEIAEDPGIALENALGQVPPVMGVPEPPGAAPAGKIWSARHGHWHNEDQPAGPGI